MRRAGMFAVQTVDDVQAILQWLQRLDGLRKLGFGQRPGEELYDLAKDPHQIINLARDPAYEKQRASLRAQLMTELKSNNDPRLNGDQFDRPPYCKIGLREVKGAKKK